MCHKTCLRPRVRAGLPLHKFPIKSKGSFFSDSLKQRLKQGTKPHSHKFWESRCMLNHLMHAPQTQTCKSVLSLRRDGQQGAKTPPHNSLTWVRGTQVGSMGRGGWVLKLNGASTCVLEPKCQIQVVRCIVTVCAHVIYNGYMCVHSILVCITC